MSLEEIRESAEELARELKTQYGLTYRWQGDTATFRGSGVDGKLSIDRDIISLRVRLGFLAAVFEQSLLRAVNEYLDEYVS
jgi:putative polyhydroxyalkanoate system protein